MLEPAHGGLTTSGSQSALGAASVEALPANMGRRYLLIQNQHASNNVFVRFGATATADYLSIRVAPGASLIFENSFIASKSVNVIASGASTPVNITSAEA